MNGRRKRAGYLTRPNRCCVADDSVWNILQKNSLVLRCAHVNKWNLVLCGRSEDSLWQNNWFVVRLRHPTQGRNSQEEGISRSSTSDATKLLGSCVQKRDVVFRNFDFCCHACQLSDFKFVGTLTRSEHSCLLDSLKYTQEQGVVACVSLCAR